jgi:hypothetical protein
MKVDYIDVDVDYGADIEHPNMKKKMNIDDSSYFNCNVLNDGHYNDDFDTPHIEA